MPRNRAQIFDLRTAYNAATAFYGNAASFFSQVPQDMGTSPVFVAQRLGRLIAAVTNLALSIELYLKSLAIGFKVESLYYPRPGKVIRCIACQVTALD